MNRLMTLLVLFLPSAAVALNWQMRSFDDGSYFRADISVPGQPGLTMLCGERSARGLSPQQTGNTEPDITRPGSVRLNFSHAEIGPWDGRTQTRTDVLIVVGTTGYRLPPIMWNELFGVWETDLAADDPVFAAIGSQPNFEIRHNGGGYLVPAAGFAQGFDQLKSHCQAMFAAIGLPWTASAAAPKKQSPMQLAAETAILQGCNGGATRSDGYVLSGNIDGDGAEDVVLLWDRVQCTGGLARPFCGASLCSTDVYLSSKFPRTGKPEQLLSQNVRLIPLSNGLTGVATVASMASCPETGNPQCEFFWYWNGSDLVRLR